MLSRMESHFASVSGGGFIIWNRYCNLPPITELSTVTASNAVILVGRSRDAAISIWSVINWIWCFQLRYMEI